MIRTVNYTEYSNLLPQTLIQEGDFLLSEADAIKVIAERTLRELSKNDGSLRVREKEIRQSRRCAKVGSEEVLLILERSVIFLGEIEQQVISDLMQLYIENSSQRSLMSLAQILKTIVWCDGDCTIAYPVTTVMDKWREAFSPERKRASMIQAVRAKSFRDETYKEAILRWMSQIDEATEKRQLRENY